MIPERIHKIAVREEEPPRFALVGRPRARVNDRDGNERVCSGESDRDLQRIG
jgi:hypothetical protein